MKPAWYSRQKWGSLSISLRASTAASANWDQKRMAEPMP